MVNADSGQRLAALAPLAAAELDRPTGKRGGVGADHHHLVTDRLDHSSLVWERLGDQCDEPVDRVDRHQLALLLGQLRIAGEVGERDGDLQPPDLAVVVLDVSLHVPDHVTVNQLGQQPPVEEVDHL